MTTNKLWACKVVIAGTALLLTIAVTPPAFPQDELTANPKVTVIDAFDGQSTYAQSPPGSDLQAKWRENVFAAYFDRCAGGGEYAFLAAAMLSQPISDLTGLRQELTALGKSDASLREAVKDTFSKAEKRLPGPDVQLCVLAAHPAMTVIQQMNGVSGLTAGTGKIIFEVRPEGEWLKFVPFAFAHEYHHSAWTFRQGGKLPSFDLAQYLVFEGRADSFAHVLFPDQTAPWDDSLSDKDEAAVWKQMQPHLKESDMMAERAFMFGGPVSGGPTVPHWAGYTIGYRIVQSWLKRHPKASVEEWTKLDAHDLIAQSGYAP